MKIKLNISSVLIRERKKRDLSAQQMVNYIRDKCNIDITAASWLNWESGKKSPLADNLIPICYVLNIELKSFIEK